MKIQSKAKTLDLTLLFLSIGIFDCHSNHNLEPDVDIPPSLRWYIEIQSIYGWVASFAMQKDDCNDRQQWPAVYILEAHLVSLWLRWANEKKLDASYKENQAVATWSMFRNVWVGGNPFVLILYELTDFNYMYF